jgi:hypothetical protein
MHSEQNDFVLPGMFSIDIGRNEIALFKDALLASGFYQFRRQNRGSGEVARYNLDS